MSSALVSKAECCKSEARRLTSAEDLRHRRDRKIAELAEIDAAIALFEKYPEVEQCLTQLAKCGIYR